MKNSYLLFFVITLSTLLASSCSQKEGSNDQIIRLPDYFEKGDFSLTEIASDIIFIPLSSDIPIPPIREINCFDSTIVIADEKLSKLYRFNFDGSFVDLLNKQGRGPGEYRAINDFYIDKSGSIYINCGTNKRILIYNNDLTFGSVIPYPQDIYPSHIHWMDSIMIFFSIDIGIPLKYDWIITNLKGKITNVRLDPSRGQVLSSYNSSSFFAFEKDSIIYRYRNWSDTIFGITRYGVYPKYVFNRSFKDGFKMISLDEIFAEPMTAAQLKSYNPQTGKRNIQRIFEIGDKLLITYSGEKRESVLFDPINNSSKIILDNNKGLPRIPNDWLGSGVIQIRNILTIGDDRYIVDFMEAYSLKSMVKSMAFIDGEPTWPEKKAEIQSLAERMHEDDNPILILIKLK